MIKLDPAQLFRQIAADLPDEFHAHVFVAGSLAAAYHYQAQLEGHAVNTKDADLVIHPAGNVTCCRQMAQQLLNSGWKRTTEQGIECAPRLTPEPVDQLRAIRLLPPDSKPYFLEFLAVPKADATEPKSWIPVKLDDGWYGLPCFRFFGPVSIDRLTSETGLQYACPAMMALANLLSHPIVGHERIESGSMRGILRSAKDLGRVIALARLEGRAGVEAWREPWLRAIRECFPKQWENLVTGLGTGLEELLQDVNALEDARRTTDIGLLSGMSVTADMLRATAERLLTDVVEPLRNDVT
jgi:hypothetical protein